MIFERAQLLFNVFILYARIVGAVESSGWRGKGRSGVFRRGSLDSLSHQKMRCLIRLRYFGNYLRTIHMIHRLSLIKCR